MTLDNTDNDIGGLSIGATYSQAKIQALLRTYWFLLHSQTVQSARTASIITLYPALSR